MTLGDRLQHAYNAFRGREPTTTTTTPYNNLGPGYTSRPDRPRVRRGTDRSMVTAILNRIAMDVAAVNINHVRVDQNGRFVEYIKSGLNECLTVEANADQTGRAFIQDAVMSMMDEGVVALVPVETDIDPRIANGYNITSMRTAKVLEWYPKHVKLLLYDERDGQKKEIVLPKSQVALPENPLYAVMNEPNSTIQRLIRKLALLDSIDEQAGYGKLDLIVQLPYVIKSEARRQQAEQRRKDIEMQLSGSKYGIAYTDGTEHITQLNRSLENNLLSQIEFLTSTLYGQLGITQSVIDGTADDKTMLNYHNSTIEPILSAIADEMKRKFLTKTARARGQSIKFFRDPFRLTPVEQLAEMADKFTRNEIMSSNEFRAILGMKPVDDARADELRNKNINQAADAMQAPMVDTGQSEEIPSEDEGDFAGLGDFSLYDDEEAEYQEE